MKREFNMDYVESELDACPRPAKSLRISDIEVELSHQCLTLEYSPQCYQNEPLLATDEGIGENTLYAEACEFNSECSGTLIDMLNLSQLSSEFMSSEIMGINSAALSCNVGTVMSPNFVYCDFQYDTLQCVNEDECSPTELLQGVVGDESPSESSQSCITTDYLSEDASSLPFDSAAGCMPDYTMFYDEYVPLNTVLDAVGRCMLNPIPEKAVEAFFWHHEAPALSGCVEIENGEYSEWLNYHLAEEDIPVLSDDIKPKTSPFLSSLLRPQERTKSITLVLDLDETLVHSMMERCDNADFTFSIFLDTKEQTVYVKRRPYLQFFLEKVAEMFEVVIFTASLSVYAEKLLDILDPEDKFFTQRLYRDSCTYHSPGNYSKDLTVLGIDLAKVAIIDNTPQVFQRQVNNGIPIKTWTNDSGDEELIQLLPFLETLATAEDVRPFIASKFGNTYD